MSLLLHVVLSILISLGAPAAASLTSDATQGTLVFSGNDWTPLITSSTTYQAIANTLQNITATLLGTTNVSNIAVLSLSIGSLVVEFEVAASVAPATTIQNKLTQVIGTTQWMEPLAALYSSQIPPPADNTTLQSATVEVPVAACSWIGLSNSGTCYVALSGAAATVLCVAAMIVVLWKISRASQPKETHEPNETHEPHEAHEPQ